MTPLSEQFVKSIGEIEGLDGNALCRALDTSPAVGIRLNRYKIDGVRGIAENGRLQDIASGKGEIPAGSRVEWCGDGYLLPERPLFTLDPLLHAGAYYVQDPSSMVYQQIVERIVGRLSEDAEPVGGGCRLRRLKVLDFCAAPGGKTTAIINALPLGSVVVANEFVAARGKILRENLEKWGYPDVVATGSSSSQYSGVPPLFDIVAVDAPCSGEGMMRKDEEARRQWRESLVKECAALQRDILGDLAGRVRPGGYLIYSTCTFNLEENERNSIYICEELGLKPVAPEELGLEGVGKAGRALLGGVEALRFMQHLTPGEGLYVSVFRRPSAGSERAEEVECSEPPFSLPSQTKPRKENRKGKAVRGAEMKQPGTPELTQRHLKELRGWTGGGADDRFELSGAMVTYLPSEAASMADMLRACGVNVTGAGLPVAELKGRGPKAELIPDSRLALNMALRQDAFPRCPLSKEEALRYLRRESLTLAENIPSGFVVVTYEGFPLGMMKNIGSRANNLYPQAWRIHISNRNDGSRH